MRIACVGGGPAGLYFSIVMKSHDPDHDITVFERNPAGSTYGWGVTYWGDLLERLHRHDPQTARAISEHSVRWTDGVAHIGRQRTVHRGDEGFSIGRRRLLDILAERATELGVDVRFDHEVRELDQVPQADLVVACDGVNSRLRQLRPGEFGTAVTEERNKYIWLGTSKVFGSFTFAFHETPAGWIWFYAYGFSDELSTCIVECSPETWIGLGLDRADEDRTLELLARIFAEPLEGHALHTRTPDDRAGAGSEARAGSGGGGGGAGGGASWLNFRTLTNATWHHDNIVLVGDAAHTTHYSIGAGTTLALEDAAALADALGRHRHLPQALASYERERKSALAPVQSAARYSAQWYESLPRYLRLTPPQFFTLLGQRHSPLMPHLPPLLYYRLHQATEEFGPVRSLRKWLGPKLMEALPARSGSGSGSGSGR
ncbi:FAD-dependent monooxygenase [Kitasatospora nipponensis]|uniref:FAD-dependent monooxygenase n=1 Tax=Kitasatospora nipponensis TaxID=258049 RepID=A0ABP4GEE9_9ACTN